MIWLDSTTLSLGAVGVGFAVGVAVGAGVDPPPFPVRVARAVLGTFDSCTWRRCTLLGDFIAVQGLYSSLTPHTISTCFAIAVGIETLPSHAKMKPQDSENRKLLPKWRVRLVFVSLCMNIAILVANNCSTTFTVVFTETCQSHIS